MTTPYTRVALHHSASRLHVYLRFGRPAWWQRVDAHRRYAFFAPGSVFCRVWWQAGPYGTSRWQVLVLQAQAPGQAVQAIAGVTPGALLLLDVPEAWNVGRALRLIRLIEARGICAADVAPSYWQVVQNRLSARKPITIYGSRRHAGQLARQSVR